MDTILCFLSWVWRTSSLFWAYISFKEGLMVHFREGVSWKLTGILSLASMLEGDRGFWTSNTLLPWWFSPFFTLQNVFLSIPALDLPASGRYPSPPPPPSASPVPPFVEAWWFDNDQTQSLICSWKAFFVPNLVTHYKKRHLVFDKWF